MRPFGGYGLEWYVPMETTVCVITLPILDDNATGESLGARCRNCSYSTALWPPTVSSRYIPVRCYGLAVGPCRSSAYSARTGQNDSNTWIILEGFSSCLSGLSVQMRCSLTPTVAGWPSGKDWIQLADYTLVTTVVLSNLKADGAGSSPS